MAMIEWKKLPRSIRLETDRFALDVWQGNVNPYSPWNYTVFDVARGGYADNGHARTQDEACERALKAAMT